MPARTLSPFLATDRALLSPPSRHTSAQHASSHAHRDAHDHRGTYVAAHRDLYYHSVLYDTASTSRYVLHANHNPFAVPDYSPMNPPFAIPMERTSVALNVFPSAPLHVQPSSSPAPGWWPHPPSVSRLPPLTPPPLLHKVWILDCKACGMFLTNRGMKAVLLLRPNVPLYSTDALPINCSAHSMMVEEGAAVKSEPPETTSPTSPAARSTEPERVQPSRTCECLTQTLYCHGCGKGVGYMIVIPCHRCTSSTTVTNRMTNGHRFVFYSCEIAPSERHYIPGEAGVMEYNVPPMPSPLLHAMPPPPVPYPPQQQAFPPVPTTPRRATRSPLRGRRGAHVRTPSSPRSRRSTVSSDLGSPPPLVPLTPPGATSPNAADVTRAHDPHVNAITNAAAAAGPDAHPHYTRIRAGDVLFWHNLVRSGEIPAVKEDSRARLAGRDADANTDGFDAAAREGRGRGRDRGACADRARDADVPQPPLKRKILAGR